MSDAFIVRRGGGGGAGLNYRVIGAALAPSNPRANDIFVDTTTAIPAYTFSTDEPTPTADGYVWFTTGGKSMAKFSALKKIDLIVYPQACYQYVSGVWVLKKAYGYIGGEWVPWALVYFRFGEINNVLATYEDYKGKAWKTGTEYNYAATKTQYDGYIQFYKNIDNQQSCGMILDKHIDFTNYDYAEIIFDVWLSGGQTTWDAASKVFLATDSQVSAANYANGSLTKYVTWNNATSYDDGVTRTRSNGTTAQLRRALIDMRDATGNYRFAAAWKRSANAGAHFDLYSMIVGCNT